MYWHSYNSFSCGHLWQCDSTIYVIAEWSSGHLTDVHTLLTDVSHCVKATTFALRCCHMNSAMRDLLTCWQTSQGSVLRDRKAELRYSRGNTLALRTAGNISWCNEHEAWLINPRRARGSGFLFQGIGIWANSVVWHREIKKHISSPSKYAPSCILLIHMHGDWVSCTNVKSFTFNYSFT